MVQPPSAQKLDLAMTLVTGSVLALRWETEQPCGAWGSVKEMDSAKALPFEASELASVWVTETAKALDSAMDEEWAEESVSVKAESVSEPELV